MDSRPGWRLLCMSVSVAGGHQIDGFQGWIGDGLRCDSDLVRNCMQVGWKCYLALQSGIFGVVFVILYRPGGHQIDGF